MVCEFPEYPVTKFADTNVKLAGKVWYEAKERAKSLIEEGKDSVLTIYGSPGMGKTTILNAVYNDLKNRAYLIYVDVSGKDSLAEPMWDWVEKTLKDRIRSDAYKLLYDHRKELGYNAFAWMRREFGNWLSKKCKEGIKGELNYALRLYCFDYPRDLEGLVEFLNDLSILGKIGILVDELHHAERLLGELHRLINTARAPIIIATTSEDYLGLGKDNPLQRRLSENKIELTSLTYDDKREILRAYCPEFAEDLMAVESVVNSKRVNELISNAKNAILEAVSRCEKEYNKVECIKRVLPKTVLPENVQKASIGLEKVMRDALGRVKDRHGIIYVHKRGKEIVTKEGVVTVDLYFETNNAIYLGDIKLSTASELSEKQLKNVEKLVGLNRLKSLLDGKEKDVMKFIVTNTDVAPPEGFKVVKLPADEIGRVVDKDSPNPSEAERLVEEMLKELGL